MESTLPTTQVVPPEGVVMQMVMGGWVARAVSEVARLNVPDLLKHRGPMRAAELVDAGLDAHAGALERVLRVCASVGLFSEDEHGRFGPTVLSDVLTTDSPASVKVLAQEVGGTWLRMWAALGDGIRTGEPQARQVFGMEWWDYLNANPNELETFGEAMKSNSTNSMRGVLEFCDLTNIGAIVDVGGGFGHLVVALLDRYPTLRGILFDVPQVIAVAPKRFPVSSPQIASRLKYESGDMFAALPSADAYILKHIIHDWDDEHALRVLRICRAAMNVDGRVICVDAVLPPMGDTSAAPAKLLDILMMVGIRGKERTKGQWEDLYAAADLRITRIVPLNDNFGTSIIEGIRR